VNGESGSFGLDPPLSPCVPNASSFAPVPSLHCRAPGSSCSLPSLSLNEWAAAPLLAPSLSLSLALHPVSLAGLISAPRSNASLAPTPHLPPHHPALFVTSLLLARAFPVLALLRTLTASHSYRFALVPLRTRTASHSHRFAQAPR
jgi:hypothetical protein